MRTGFKCVLQLWSIIALVCGMAIILFWSMEKWGPMAFFVYLVIALVLCSIQTFANGLKKEKREAPE